MTESMPRVLVVQNTPTQAAELRSILEPQGYEVAVVEDGPEALEALRQQLPALLLCDVLIPEMDGYELCQTIRADAALAALPVVLITPMASANDALRVLHSGANGFIAKPWTAATISRNIAHVLANRARNGTGTGSGQVRIVLQGQEHFLPSNPSRYVELMICAFDNAVTINRLLADTREALSQQNQVSGWIERRFFEAQKELQELRASGVSSAGGAAELSSRQAHIAELGTDVELLYRELNDATAQAADALAALEAAELRCGAEAKRAARLEAEVAELRQLANRTVIAADFIDKPGAEAARDTTATAAPDPWGARRGRILVVDDSAFAQTLTARWLDRLGFDCLQANDGAAAVELCEAHNFDAILMDLVMPRLDGIRATVAIRQKPRHAETPIIAITSSETPTRIDCLRAGMTAYLRKPVLISDIEAVLRRSLPVKSSEVPPAAR